MLKRLTNRFKIPLRVRTNQLPTQGDVYYATVNVCEGVIVTVLIHPLSVAKRY